VTTKHAEAERGGDRAIAKYDVSDVLLRKLVCGRQIDELIGRVDVADANETSQGIVMLSGAERSRSIWPGM
jgi:hypothetical protein